jgi:hypothetical protein
MPKLPFDVNEFNPERSEKLGDWTPGDASRGSFQESEHLYKTERGYYFILLDGALYSRFSEFPGAEIWYGGLDIQPVSEEEAVQWCEETGNYEIIEENFTPSI